MDEGTLGTGFTHRTPAVSWLPDHGWRFPWGQGLLTVLLLSPGSQTTGGGSPGDRVYSPYSCCLLAPSPRVKVPLGTGFTHRTPAVSWLPDYGWRFPWGQGLLTVLLLSPGSQTTGGGSPGDRVYSPHSCRLLAPRPWVEGFPWGQGLFTALLLSPGSQTTGGGSPGDRVYSPHSCLLLPPSPRVEVP